MTAHAKEKGLSLREAKEELCRHRAQALRGHFTHAWRLYDAQIHDKILEAVYGIVNEVVTQSIWELPSPALPVTGRQLYRIATNEEETQRKRRMSFGSGGRRSEFNLRWFPHNYAQAYRELLEGAKIYEKAKRSTDKKVREGWRAEVKQKFPELDDELIARLSGKATDLTEEHHAVLAEKGGDSTPSEIALEQAARRCGIKRYTYTKRALLKRLEIKKSRSQAQGLMIFLVNWHGHGEKLDSTVLKHLLPIVGA